MTLYMNADWVPDGRTSSRYPTPYTLQLPGEDQVGRALARDVGYIDPGKHVNLVATAHRTTCREMGLTWVYADVVEAGQRDPRGVHAFHHLGQRRTVLRNSPLLTTRDLVEIGVRAALMDGQVAHDLSGGLPVSAESAVRRADLEAQRYMRGFDRAVARETPEPGRQVPRGRQL